MIEEAFSAPIYDRYGASEFAVSMTACSEGRLHVDMEFGHVEVEVVEETDDWERGALIVTGFANAATPMIRYRIGDVGTRSKRPCVCGRPGDVFLDVDGRVEDYVVTPDGRWIGRLDHIFKEQTSIAEAQIVQDDASAIEVRFVPSALWNEGSEPALLREIRSRLGDEIRVDLTRLEEIPREANGKFRAVKSPRGEEWMMIRVGLARCRPSYDGITTPWGPGKSYPEIDRLLGEGAASGPVNEVYATVRESLRGLGLDAERYGTPDWNPIGALVAPGSRIVLKPNLIRHWNPADDGRGGTVAMVQLVRIGLEGKLAIAPPTFAELPEKTQLVTTGVTSKDESLWLYMPPPLIAAELPTKRQLISSGLEWPGALALKPPPRPASLSWKTQPTSSGLPALSRYIPPPRDAAAFAMNEQQRWRTGAGVGPQAAATLLGAQHAVRVPGGDGQPVEDGRSTDAEWRARRGSCSRRCWRSPARRRLRDRR